VFRLSYLGRSHWKARASWVQARVKAAGKKKITTVFWPCYAESRKVSPTVLCAMKSGA
jgi:hypothetical protein